MKALDYLIDYAKGADHYIDLFFKQKKIEAGKISPLVVQMLTTYRNFMQGGKKTRGALTYLGYRSAGGKNKQVGMKASIALEVLHNFLLMHDDWIDHDFTRRGKPTVHVQYERYFKTKKFQGDAQHWGANMAILLGDGGHALVYNLLSQLDCPAELINKAINRLSHYSLLTVYGEILDITNDSRKVISDQEILMTRKLKTAYYSMVMPLSVGATLAGADDRQIKAIEKFGLSVGIAFQLRDDELGLFGNEKVTGKSNKSDLIEGRKTLLISRALNKLSKKDNLKLLSVWGNSKATVNKIKMAKKLIIKSGALNDSQIESKKLVNQGKSYIPRITKIHKYQNLLSGLADFMIEREK